jgi:hypothetical protein
MRTLNYLISIRNYSSGATSIELHEIHDSIPAENRRLLSMEIVSTARHQSLQPKRDANVIKGLFENQLEIKYENSK